MDKKLESLSLYLTAIFIFLKLMKLTEVADWSWWIVFSPIIIVFSIYIFLFFLLHLW